MLDHEHPQATRRHQYRYLFTSKHHGGHGDGQRSDSLSEDDEFSIFDGADEMELSDADVNLFGTLPDGEDNLRILDNEIAQIAKFPRQSEGSPWHGYPVWPLSDGAPANRRRGPPKEFYDKMVTAGLINQEMRRRLRKGDHV